MSHRGLRVSHAVGHGCACGVCVCVCVCMCVCEGRGRGRGGGGRGAEGWRGGADTLRDVGLAREAVSPRESSERGCIFQRPEEVGKAHGSGRRMVAPCSHSARRASIFGSGVLCDHINAGSEQ